MTTYTIQQWPSFLKAIKGKRIKLNAMIGTRILYVTVKPADFKEVLLRSKIDSFDVDIMDSCAFVEDSFNHCSIARQ